jgi:hypothetical protein
MDVEIEDTETKQRAINALDALEVAEDRLKGFELRHLNVQDLLLLSIARSLREANRLAKEGLEWSKSLASKLE